MSHLLSHKKESDLVLSAMEATRFKWGEGNGTPLQYSCLENPMERGAW